MKRPPRVWHNKHVHTCYSRAEPHHRIHAVHAAVLAADQYTDRVGRAGVARIIDSNDRLVHIGLRVDVAGITVWLYFYPDCVIFFVLFNLIRERCRQFIFGSHVRFVCGAALLAVNTLTATRFGVYFTLNTLTTVAYMLPMSLTESSHARSRDHDDVRLQNCHDALSLEWNERRIRVGVLRILLRNGKPVPVRIHADCSHHVRFVHPRLVICKLFLGLRAVKMRIH